MKANKSKLEKDKKDDKIAQKMFNFKLSEKQKKFLVAVSPFWISALVIMLAGLWILSIAFPVQAQPFNFTWNGVLMWLAISAGVGWIVHGTGFL